METSANKKKRKVNFTPPPGTLRMIKEIPDLLQIFGLRHSFGMPKRPKRPPPPPPNLQPNYLIYETRQFEKSPIDKKNLEDKKGEIQKIRHVSSLLGFILNPV